MTDTRETPEQQRARLNETPQGRALMALIALYPTKRELTQAIGAAESYIWCCAMNGQISAAGALAVDKLGIMTKEQLRPDVTDWDKKRPGLPIGGKAKRDGSHQVLLRDLAIHFGSVKSFCRTAGISIRNFHDWLTRGKISKPGLEKILIADWKGSKLRARVKAAIDKGVDGG